MAEVTSPILTDDTFADKMDDLIAAVQPQASGVGVSTANMHYITEDDAQGALAELDAECYSLNNSLTNNTYSTTGLTTNASCTINVGGYVKVGKIVIVNIRLTTTASISAGQGIVWGFPTPVYFNANYIELFNNDVIHLYMDTSGKILTGASLPSGTHIISGVYVCG